MSIISTFSCLTSINYWADDNENSGVDVSYGFFAFDLAQ